MVATDGTDGYLVRGSCGCGAVTFELTERPLAAGYCHCNRCQKRTGAGAGCSASINPAALRWLSGQELISGWNPAGGGNTKLFCSHCGSHLASRNPHDHAQMGIRMSAFDSDPGIRPSFHQYVAYAASWEAIPDDGLERFPEGRR